MHATSREIQTCDEEVGSYYTTKKFVLPRQVATVACSCTHVNVWLSANLCIFVCIMQGRRKDF